MSVLVDVDINKNKIKAFQILLSYFKLANMIPIK